MRHRDLGMDVAPMSRHLPVDREPQPSEPGGQFVESRALDIYGPVVIVRRVPGVYVIVCADEDDTTPSPHRPDLGQVEEPDRVSLQAHGLSKPPHNRVS